MNINRNNYEEYFLLYADNELSVQEKNMVESFVQQHSDLEEEFIMLQQSILKPDNTIKLHDKSFLLREEDFIDTHNYEEKFLLYTDNELDASEKELTEKFVEANPSMEAEFTLLRSVTYEPDISITFPDKSLLYKKEDNGRVIPFWWKALAAALLTGMGLWGGINYLQKNKTEPEIVIGKETKPARDNNIINPAEQEPDPDDIAEIKNKKNDPLRIPVQDTRIQNKQPPVIVKNNVPVNNYEIKTPEVKKEDLAVVEAVKTDVIKPENLSEPSRTTVEPNDQNVDKAAIPQVNDYAMQTYYIADAQVKSENYVFYNITAEEFRNSKVGNFLKKVKRSIENRNPLKNKRLRIGNVEIIKDIEN